MKDIEYHFKNVAFTISYDKGLEESQVQCQDLHGRDYLSPILLDSRLCINILWLPEVRTASCVMYFALLSSKVKYKHKCPGELIAVP